MIVACPSCIARYHVEVETLGATGRRVRCNRCGHVWHAEPPGYVVEILHAEPEPEPSDTRPEVASAAVGVEAHIEPPKHQLPVPAGQVRRARGPSPLTWILSVLLLAACVVGYEARHSIAREWPWLASVYETLGMELEEGQDTRPARPE